VRTSRMSYLYLEAEMT